MEEAPQVEKWKVVKVEIRKALQERNRVAECNQVRGHRNHLIKTAKVMMMVRMNKCTDPWSTVDYTIG